MVRHSIPLRHPRCARVPRPTLADCLLHAGATAIHVPGRALMRHLRHPRLPLFLVFWAAVCLLATSAPAASESLCDPASTDCRAPLLALIANEHAKIEVAFDEMEDSVIADALIKRFKAGVPVRVIADARRNSVSPDNAITLQKL